MNLATIQSYVATYLTAPTIVSALAAVMVYQNWPSKTKTLAQESTKVCQSKYCGPREMFVDKPKNTEMKDQSLGTGLSVRKKPAMPSDVFEKIQSDLYDEQLRSPGVRLVAHTVV